MLESNVLMNINITNVGTEMYHVVFGIGCKNGKIDFFDTIYA